MHKSKKKNVICPKNEIFQLVIFIVSKLYKKYMKTPNR